MKKRLAVIGAGSGGVITMCYFLARLSNEWEVVSIYDPTVPILGIGESTNPSFIRLLEMGARFSVSEDTPYLDSTLKFGTQFIKWRDHEWLNPLISGGIAVHFNNFKLKEFCFSRFPNLWPEKFKVIEGNIEKITNGDKATITVNGKDEVFDFVIDCGGFPKDYTGYTYSKCSLLNHCLVHSFEKFDPIQYTEHIATPHGWMFGIPLTSRKTYGYLFNDEITSMDDAVQNMAETLNVSPDELNLKEYKFRPYYKTHLVDKAIMANGNRALFYEPISATSINQYNSTCDVIFYYITGQVSEKQANERFTFESNTTEDIINYYYHGGTTYDSEFWRAAVANAKNNLKHNERFNEVIDYNHRAYQLGLPYNGKGHLFSQYNLFILDEAFGYNYFKGAPRQFDQ